MNNFITTYSGHYFDPINPKREDIDIKDIAHCLSYMCRANGHCLFFYSVAQHSINCAIEAKARGYSKKVQLACLLHDGSEAYMADIVRPFKRHLPDYLILEKNLQEAIWSTFGIDELTKEEYDVVFKIDDIMLYNEFDYTMKENTIPKNEKTVGHVLFTPHDTGVVERMFLKKFNELSA